MRRMVLEVSIVRAARGAAGAFDGPTAVARFSKQEASELVKNKCVGEGEYPEERDSNEKSSGAILKLTAPRQGRGEDGAIDSSPIWVFVSEGEKDDGPIEYDSSNTEKYQIRDLRKAVQFSPIKHETGSNSYDRKTDTPDQPDGCKNEKGSHIMVEVGTFCALFP